MAKAKTLTRDRIIEICRSRLFIRGQLDFTNSLKPFWRFTILTVNESEMVRLSFECSHVNGMISYDSQSLGPAENPFHHGLMPFLEGEWHRMTMGSASDVVVMALYRHGRQAMIPLHDPYITFILGRLLETPRRSELSDKGEARFRRRLNVLAIKGVRHWYDMQTEFMPIGLHSFDPRW